jgi:hypothetical protein
MSGRITCPVDATSGSWQPEIRTTLVATRQRLNQ